MLYCNLPLIPDLIIPSVFVDLDDFSVVSMVLGSQGISAQFSFTGFLIGKIIMTGCIFRLYSTQ
jgi:hypothetical protein